MFTNCVHITLFPLLTLEYRPVDKRIGLDGVPAQVNVVVELQLLRVLRVGQAVKQRNHPIGHGSLCQYLVHHIITPVILNKVRSDKQSS